MRKWAWMLSCSGALCAGAAVPVQAGGWFSWWSSDQDTVPGVRMEQHSGKTWPLSPRPTGPKEPFVHRFHSAHYWPDPYRWEDRAVVHEALAVQKANGWITATTLFDQHFDGTTNELNLAGRVHLQWILLHAPPEHRYTWVASTSHEEINQRRLTSVQHEAQLIAGKNVPPIMIRVGQPTYNAAQESDLIRRAYLQSFPKPRVEYVPLNGGGGGGGSSGGGGSGSGGGQGAGSP